MALFLSQCHLRLDGDLFVPKYIRDLIMQRLGRYVNSSVVQKPGTTSRLVYFMNKTSADV